MLDYEKWLEQHMLNGNEYTDLDTYAKIVADKNTHLIPEITQTLKDRLTPVLQNNKAQKSRGLGDTIAKVTHKEIAGVSIASVVTSVSKYFGINCGCEQRQETANRLFPYKDK